MTDRELLGLDLTAGRDLFAQEIYGDWYRDPWGWPEFKWIQSNIEKIRPSDFYDNQGKQLKFEPVFHTMEVPKSHLGIRPAVIQDPLSRFWYLTAAASSMKKLHSNLPDFVFGWREPRFAPNNNPSNNKKQDASNDAEWDRYIDHVRAGINEEAGLQADITSFFASIDIPDLMKSVGYTIGQTVALSIMRHVAEVHGRLSRRSGLPQRSYGSAALANFFMGPMDDVLSRALESGKITRAARWMDDIVAFGPEEALYSIYLELQEKSRMIGLELNSAKGKLGSAEDAVRAIDLEQVREVEIAWKELRSDYDGGLDVEASGLDEEDLDSLDELVELEKVALSQGPDASRPWLRATLSSLTKSGNFERILDWRANAKNIPHAADSLGRYFRAAAEEGYIFKPAGQPAFRRMHQSWPELSEWLVSHFRSEWARIDWVKAQLALAVPSSKVDDNLIEVLRDWFSTSLNMQLVAVAGQRLSELKPDLACEIVRNRADTIHDPLLQRVLALCLLQTKKDRNLVESIVRRSPSNLLLLHWLEANQWRPAKVSRDFDRESTKG